MEISAKTIEFTRKHASDDVRRLAFVASKELGEDAPFALDQIAGRQTALRKLPSWAEKEGVIFPPHISMEQCSSEQTARYKATCLSRYISCMEDATLIDLTGGFGVDFSIMARPFGHAVYVERQQHLCEIARHNLPLLGLDGAVVVNADAEEVVGSIEKLRKLGEPGSIESIGGLGDLGDIGKLGNHGIPGDLAVFIDPARRDSHGGRTFAIADCTPDILGFINDLLEKTSVVMVKLSPMLDWHATVYDINKVCGSRNVVREVHIVSTANECKELLLVLSLRNNDATKLYCVNDDDVFVMEADGERDALRMSEQEDNTPTSANDDRKYLLVPNASVMKAGCFDALERRFGVKQLAASSHLFLSKETKEGFPGRTFCVDTITTMNKKELKGVLASQGLTHANISCRNFPLSPDELRKRLKLKDGGSCYVFATTMQDDTRQGSHILIFCHLQPLH